MKLAELTLSQYLEVMGSDAPAPGGGSAAALCGAQGAALIAMVAGLTIGKKKYEQYEENCIRIREEAQALLKKLEQQIDRDTEAFNLVASAFKLPKTTDEEKKIRSAAIQAGTLEATRVPFETMVLALEDLKLGERLLAGFNEGAASDLGVAAWNLRTCVRGAWMNVSINLGSLKDRETGEYYRTRGREILETAEKIAGAITAHAESVICG